LQCYTLYHSIPCIYVHNLLVKLIYKNWVGFSLSLFRVPLIRIESNSHPTSPHHLGIPLETLRFFSLLWKKILGEKLTVNVIHFLRFEPMNMGSSCVMLLCVSTIYAAKTPRMSCLKAHIINYFLRRFTACGAELQLF